MATKTDHIVPDFLLSPQKRVYRHLLLQLIVFFITINVFWDTPDELIITPPRIRSWIGYFLMIDMLSMSMPMYWYRDSCSKAGFSVTCSVQQP